MIPIYDGAIIGGPEHQGFMFGGVVYFTADDTFDKADYPGLRAVRVRAVGGGGAGGGAATTGGGQSSAGHGGSGAGYSESFLLASDLAESETITVGAGGAGSSGATGATGEDSSFGSHVVAPGGIGGGVGGASSNTILATGTEGPAAGTGDLAHPGGVGGGSFRDPAQPRGGGGGSTAMTTSRRELANPGASGVDGDDAGSSNYGCGGCGAANSPSQGTTRKGGAGADGIVIVELYL